MKTKTETKLVPDCHRGTKLNLVTAPGQYSRFNSLESPSILEHKHEVVTRLNCFRSIADRAEKNMKIERSNRNGNEPKAE